MFDVCFIRLAVMIDELWTWLMPWQTICVTHPDPLLHIQTCDCWGIMLPISQCHTSVGALVLCWVIILPLIFVLWFFKTSSPLRDDDPLSSHIKKDHYLNSIDFIGKKDGFPWYFSVFEFDILMSGKNTLHLSVLKSKYR